MLDPENAGLLIDAKDAFQEMVRAQGRALPKNYNARKFLDCAIFQYLYEIQHLRDEPIDTTRAVYVPTGQDKRLWERSWLYRETHIQLCVRNPDNILGTWLAEPREH